MGVDLKVEGEGVVAGTHLTFDGRITDTGYDLLRKLSKAVLALKNGEASEQLAFTVVHAMFIAKSSLLL